MKMIDFKCNLKGIIGIENSNKNIKRISVKKNGVDK
jgi:hypothetical protein